MLDKIHSLTNSKTSSKPVFGLEDGYTYPTAEEEEARDKLYPAATGMLPESDDTLQVAALTGDEADKDTVFIANDVASDLVDDNHEESSDSDHHGEDDPHGDCDDEEVVSTNASLTSADTLSSQRGSCCGDVSDVASQAQTLEGSSYNPALASVPDLDAKPVHVGLDTLKPLPPVAVHAPPNPLDSIPLDDYVFVEVEKGKYIRVPPPLSVASGSEDDLALTEHSAPLEAYGPEKHLVPKRPLRRDVIHEDPYVDEDGVEVLHPAWKLRKQQPTFWEDFQDVFLVSAKTGEGLGKLRVSSVRFYFCSLGARLDSYGVLNKV